ncbi:MAG: right-handed parallel beta-helix repeat-containing protein, partial [Spirochaetia bacterium]|nr:right-handed parallel beta-helix repeat-containing protein [Spirochaetia bacterium]
AKTFGTGLSESVTFEGITIYSSPGASYVGWFCSLINVIGCRTILKPGRWQTTGADGVHLQSQRIGPWIEGCVFEAVADDCVNIYTRILPVKSVYGNGFFIPGVPPNALPGDSIVFFSQLTGAAPKIFPLVELVEKGAQMRFGEMIPNEPPLVEPGAWQIYNTSLAGNGYVILSNTFKDSRRYGLLLKASRGLVEGNVFEGLSASGITLRNIDNVEGLNCEEVLIRGNVFRECGFDAEYKKSTHIGLVALGLFQKGNIPASWQGQKNIRIVENRFESHYPRSISVRSATQVSILSNRFSIFENGSVPPISISNASKVLVEDNKSSEPKNLKGFVESDLTVSELRMSRNR